MSWLRVLVAAAENVVLPVAAYLVLTMVGWAPVWALVGASAVSVIVLGVGYSRTRELSTLGILVLGRFTVGIAVALVTGDPRLELAKDFAITGLIGVVAGVSLGWRRPLIARIRRDLAGEVARFDHRWETLAGFSRLHRRLTVLWTVGLLAEAASAVVLIYSLPLTAAVVATNVISPATLFGLISWTEYRARRWISHHDPHEDAVRR